MVKDKESQPVGSVIASHFPSGEALVPGQHGSETTYHAPKSLLSDIGPRNTTRTLAPRGVHPVLLLFLVLTGAIVVAAGMTLYLARLS